MAHKALSALPGKQNYIVSPSNIKQNRKRSVSPDGKEAPFKRPYVIGICGGPSSGKSTVAHMIKEKLPEAVILNLIHYYKPVRGNLRRSRANSHIDEEMKPEEVEEEKRRIYRKNDFDTPDAIDWELLNSGLENLLNNKPFNKPIYDQEEMVRCAYTEHIKPSPVIIIEGHLIFCNE